ncbi:MAG TPA: phosphatase PAP2 family protein, partial [Melioribacteraceae bacterium]|nr:phosphatase PAP2 family protein [Melioribacteraceae bacterium]
TLSFALFTTLSLNTKNRLLKIAYFVPAVITGISRIVHNKHWLSDVFLGAAVGYFSAHFVHSLHNDSPVYETAIPQQSNLINLSVPLF